MIFFTGDQHINHTNVIGFCNRPFNDVQEMNEHIVKSWNKVVSDNDEVYFLGDFCLRCNKKTARYYLHKLNGVKYFIKGNHDKNNYLNDFLYSGLIKWWKHSYEFSYEHEGKVYDFALCHYPLYPIKNSDSICIYGHSHGNSDFIIGSLDVGVDNIGYEPISIINVIKLINNQRNGRT